MCLRILFQRDRWLDHLKNHPDIIGDCKINGPTTWIDLYICKSSRGTEREERIVGGRIGTRHAVHAVRRVDPEINGALITLIEALRRIDTTPIGPVSFRDTDRSYDK